MRYAQHFNPYSTPQSESAKPGQVENSAGGYVFAVDKWTQLDRFLILGCEGNTYYASEYEMTRDNAKNVLACIDEDGARAVARIVEISHAGRAPKNDAAVFALALAASAEKPETRAAALAALPKVCRIGTHLFQFVDAVQGFRGWGPGLCKAIGKWYTDRSPASLANQVLKYQSREKWSHKDVLRLSHPSVSSLEHAAIFEWVRAGMSGFEAREVARKSAGRVDKYEPANREALPKLLSAYEEMKAAKFTKDVVKLIVDHGFTREMVPTQHLNSPEVWEAMLIDMPMTAMIRNLGKMSSIGVIKPLSNAAMKVAASLGDRDALKKARVHPIALLSALKVYEQGHGEKGKLSWTAERSVVDALNEAFYLAFDHLEPTGKNWLIAVDISGSMAAGNIAGMPGLTPREAAAAMAMVTARTEKNWHAIGFTQRVVPITISPKQRLDDVVRAISQNVGEQTDAAQPMLYAAREKLGVDAFALYTDNETWAGAIHPFQALQQYRQKLGRHQSKCMAVAMTATRFSIADPSDAGMLDVVGFDAATPQIMADFARA
jgi:60 kDa SS-A/Ro ribonucleoprotein